MKTTDETATMALMRSWLEDAPTEPDEIKEAE